MNCPRCRASPFRSPLELEKIVLLKLYGGTRSRASLVQWYLEEIEVPYEFVTLDLQAGEQRQADYLAINPMGKVPAIADGEFTLWESGAILLYLAEKYDRLPESLEGRAQISQWVVFANATLSESLSNKENREGRERLLQPLDERLGRQTFLTGEEFTVADVAAGSLLAYASLVFGMDLNPYPHVSSYVGRLCDRPAFQKTIGLPAPKQA